MRNNFLNLVAKMPQNTGGGCSRTKNRSVTVSLSSDTTTNREMTERRPREDRETFVLRSSLLGTLKYVACLLLALVLGVGQMWADCEKGTLIFSMEVTSAPSNKIQIAAKSGSTNGSLDLVANENVTVVGTSAVMYNSNSSAYDAITTAGEICFKNQTKHWIEISFPCALQAGDKISFTTSKTNPIAFSGTASGTKYSTTDNKLEISTSGTSELIGKTSLWIWRPGSEPNVKSLRIIRPLTITLDATTNGGTVSVTSIEGAIGDKVVLPHAFKSGNIFSGWFGNATGGSPKDNYYAINSDETVYAQFAAIPESGDLFSLEMLDALKPAKEVSLDKGYQVDLLQYAAVSGGAAFACNTTSSSNHMKITTAGKLSFAGTAAYLKIDLDFALAEGDEIATDASAKLWVSASATTSAPSSGPFVDGSNQTYVVGASDGLKNNSTIYIWRSSNATLTTITITRPAPAATHTLAWDFAGGSCSATEGDDYTAGGAVAEGATLTYPAANTMSKTDYLFDGWSSSATTMPTTDLTITAQWATAYTVTFASNGGGGTMDPIQYKADAEVTIPACDFTPEDAYHAFTHWAITGVAGKTTGNPGETFDMPAGPVTLIAQWAASYGITKGSHTNGDFTIDPTSAAAGTEITLAATPDEDYLFGAWEVVKTSDGTDAGVTVTNNKFEMPAFAVTVNATFVADTRKKVLYLTTTNEATTIANDKLYAALKDDYKVTIAAPDAQTLTNYDLVVLHESINGKAAAPDDATNRKHAILDAKTTSVPVLNTKTYFYNSGRWDWGTPNNGQADQRTATLNSGYCNVADHPIFAGVTITAGAVTVLTDGATGNTMQPVEPSSGKEGYLLATTPNKEGGESSYAIQEIPAGGFRGASSGKYILISVSNAGLNNLTADGQKLFKNAAAYLTSATTWTPITVPTAPEITGTTAYTEGDNISLTASATGATSATFTWYKGADWATASAGSSVGTGATFTKNSCVTGDAGTYWCNISNGTDCDVQVSATIVVASASAPTHAITYDNTKGADMSAYPTEYTEGIGVASFAALADITGWHFVEWSPATIETTATTDQTITAVWAQEFQVTFNLKGHGDPIAPQDVVDGELATDPGDPAELGYDFGGWFTDEDCTAGNEFSFSTPITATTPLYAKWTAFAGCTLLVPATSGDAPAVGDPISMQSGSKGGSMSVIGTPLSYNTYGLGFDSNSSAKAKVTINNEIQEGTVISLTLVANGTSSPRGLHLYTGDGATKITSLGWTSDMVKYTEETYTYTVQSTDVALIGTNEFQLWRNSSVFLKQLTVTNCGDPVIFHNLTSEIAPDHDPAYATVTLGASSVREGYTTTATYSDIDAAYEFDEWQISGTGASIADASANPAVITMGTADAVVTLKLKVATPKHTVTFNKMGKGDDIASQLVAEGALVSEPSVTEPEGWLLEGWYIENTLENKWDFASDVMSTSNIELFANWVADTSIKLVNKSTGAINTTNFTTAVAAEADVDGEKGAVFNANRDAISSVSALNEMVQYNATTTQTKIQLVMYNTSSAEKTIHLFKVAEGDDAATLIDITIDGNSRKTTEYYTFNSDKNRSFYITVSDKKVQILQMRVVESGTALKQFGQAGYSLNLNKGRIFAKSGNAVNFEGATVTVNSDYKVLNNSNLSTNSYIQFNNAVANTVLKVTRSGGNYYVSQDPEDKGTSYNKNEEIVLSATGTWYLGSTSSGSSASFTKIEFIAPKCQKPTFDALVNSDICDGDPYVALDGTGTVTDGGTVTYKWYAEGGTDVLGTDATYMPAADGSYFVVALHHVDGYTDNEATSDVVTVTTHTGTVISEGLVNQRGVVDAVVTLTVTASGKDLHYTWKQCATIDGTYTDVAGATDAASLNVTITEGLNKYYKVIVHSDCGADQESIAKVEQFVPVVQQNVTGSTVWDWTEAASVDEIKLTDATTPEKNEGFVMANGAATVYNNANFESDKLYLEGEYIIRKNSGNLFFQGQTVKFYTTVAGLVRVTFSNTGGNPSRELYVNGVGTGFTSANGTLSPTGYIEVPAGEVSITAYLEDKTSDAAQKYVRISKIEFFAENTARARTLAVGNLGTTCIENECIVRGAEIYAIKGKNEIGKIVFEELGADEVLEAGHPYVMVAKEANIRFFNTIADPAPAGEDNGLIGTFEQKVFAAGTASDGLYFFKDHALWAAKTTGMTIPAYRCYLKMDEVGPVSSQNPAPGRRRIVLGVQGEQVATGIDELNASETPVKVMIDGQLFIIRGEKMYNANGQLVK